MREIELLETLNAAVLRCINTNEVAIAFSGGLDSALITFLGKKRTRVRCYTVGVVNAEDLVWGAHAAHLLGVAHQRIELGEEEALALAKEFAKITGINSVLTLSYELPVFALLKLAGEMTIITGAGADELFGGYKRYLSMSPAELETNQKNDLEKAIREREIERQIAAKFGKQICTPYMDESIVRFAFSLPFEEKISGGRRKIILRECAKIAGVPQEIYEKEKKAAQYSSGIYKVLKKRLDL
ncbi:MAG: asparagine synthase C-terminal domain-containing protein [Thermoplasmata archaeon]|nr:asparagine synthase C-terminal domain-containing protein [Thermoplasmata archaeon]